MIRNNKGYSLRTEGGFTLLEMIVAVTLVAMMAVGLWSVFRISIRSWSRGTQFIDTNQRHRSIIDMVRKQMASTYGLFTAVDLQTGNTPYLIFSGSETSVRFVSLNSLQFQQSPGLTLVSYEVAQGSNGDYSLVEREGRYLGQAPDEQDTTQGKAIEILGSLMSCVFEYFDPGDNNNPSGWVKDWDGQKLGRLPTAISMTMTSRDAKGNALNRHMIVPIQMRVTNARVNFVNPFGARVVQ